MFGGTPSKYLSILNERLHQEEPASPMVKVGKRGSTVQRGQICEVKCHLRTLTGGTVLFEPAVESSLPHELELFSALVDVPAGISKTMRISIHNLTQHDIFLPPKTLLGSITCLQPVSISQLPRRQPIRLMTPSCAQPK